MKKTPILLLLLGIALPIATARAQTSPSRDHLTEAQYSDAMKAISKHCDAEFRKAKIRGEVYRQFMSTCVRSQAELRGVVRPSLKPAPASK